MPLKSAISESSPLRAASLEPVVLDIRELSSLESTGAEAIRQEAIRARSAHRRLILVRGPSLKRGLRALLS